MSASSTLLAYDHHLCDAGPHTTGPGRAARWVAGRLLPLLLLVPGCSNQPSAPPAPSEDGATLPLPSEPVPDGGGQQRLDGSAPWLVHVEAGLEEVACDVVAPTACPTPMPHYVDVEPILQRRCVTCHYGAPKGPWPLTAYSHAVDWFDIIRGSMLNCTMPPPDSGLVMSNAERLLVLEWLRCGYPR